MIIWEVVVLVDYDVVVVADYVAVVVVVLPLLNDVMWSLFYARYMVVDYLLWIICLLLLNVKSHPFCLKILLFVWVTCRWSRLAVDCCCEWLPLTVSLGALIRNEMGNFVIVFYSLRIIFMRFYEHDVETYWWDFTLRPSCQSCFLRFLK